MTNCYIANVRYVANNHEMDQQYIDNLATIGQAFHSSLLPDIKYKLYSQSHEAFSGIQSMKELEQ